MTRAAYEELLRSPVGALASYRDADGRPLCGEAIVDDPGFRAQLELKRCPYAGSRKHHALPMNVSALKQMTRSWADILATARLVHHAFGGAAAGPAAPARIMRIAYGAMCLPLYLLYRATGPLRDREVPGFVSGLHKAAIDVATGAQLMLLIGHAGGDVSGGLHELIEREGLLVGPAGVCAGPPHMIDELLAALAGGGAPEPGELARVERTLGDLTGLVGYVDALLELTTARQLIGADIRRRVDALRARCAALAEADPAAREPAARLADAAARHPVPTRPSEIIQRQDRVLRELPADRHDALVAAIAQARTALTPSAAHAAGGELLAQVRRGAPRDPAEVRRALELAGRRDGDRWAVAIAEAVVDSARLDRLAIAFYTAIEVALCRALGRPAGSPALASDQLARVFGRSPAHYLGELLDLDVAIGDGRTELSRRCEGSRRADSPPPHK